MKWAIREAVDVYFKAKSAFTLGARSIRIGEPVLIFDTVKTSTLEVGSETSYVTGGRGNSRILSYEGDKTLTFNFEEALLSAEGMAILAGADLIPARNKHLPGASAAARSVISHYTEKYSISTANISDTYEGLGTDSNRNKFPIDEAIVDGGNKTPRGGIDNVWVSRKPYVGQNASIYVMLLDTAGEVSGAPIEVNLNTNGENHATAAQIAAAKAAMETAKTAYDDGTTVVIPASTAYDTAKAAYDVKVFNDPMSVNYVSGSDATDFETAETTYLTQFDAAITAATAQKQKYQLTAAKYRQAKAYYQVTVEKNALATTYAHPDLAIFTTAMNDAKTVMDGVETAMNAAKTAADAGRAAYESARKDYLQKNSGTQQVYLRKFQAGDKFIAFDNGGVPISLDVQPDPVTRDEMAIFDDGVMHYVDADSCIANWVTGWGNVNDYIRTIPAGAGYGAFWGDPGVAGWSYTYLLQPSGGIAQPKCFKEGSQFVYKINVPSIMYQDIVLIDFYVEYAHNATQVSILPDKFAPFMYVEGSSLLRRASDGMDLPVEFVIPKFKITTQLSFTLQSTGDASTFNFQGDAYPDFSKFDLSRKVLADIQILDADDNYDGAAGNTNMDPTSYRRYKYNDDTDGDYLWKDPAIEAHNNIDYSDAYYDPTFGGPATVNSDSANNGLIYHD